MVSWPTHFSKAEPLCVTKYRYQMIDAQLQQKTTDPVAFEGTGKKQNKADFLLFPPTPYSPTTKYLLLFSMS